MVDVNERALNLAKESACYNQLEDVTIYKSSVYENVKGTFDVIVSNPPIRAGKTIVFEILEKAYHHLNDSGTLFVVIQKKQGAPSAKKKMEDVFGNCEIIKRDKGYFVLKSVNNTVFDASKEILKFRFGIDFNWPLLLCIIKCYSYIKSVFFACFN